jgi:hypothetical protein
MADVDHGGVDMQDKPLPTEHLSPPVLVFITYLVLAPYTVLASFIPDFSWTFLILSIFLDTVGAVGTILVGRKLKRLGQLLFSNAFFLLFLLLGSRAWLKIVSNIYVWEIWMAVVMLAYLLAWALPRINPKITAKLWKEQYSPETKSGRALLKIFAVFLPIAGAGGAFIGIYSQNENPGLLFIGIAACLVSIGLAQVTSYQFWREDQLQDTRAQE